MWYNAADMLLSVDEPRHPKACPYFCIFELVVLLVSEPLVQNPGTSAPSEQPVGSKRSCLQDKIHIQCDLKCSVDGRVAKTVKRAPKTLASKCR